MTSRLCFAAAATAALFIALPGIALADTTPPAPAPPGSSSSGPVETRAPSAPSAPVGPATTVAPVPAAPAPAAPTPAPGQVGVVPVGAADTGGGSTAPGSAETLLVLGGLGLAGAGALVVVRRRTA